MSLNDKLVVAILSIDIIDGDKNANIENTVAMAQSLKPRVDLVVIPELFSTGFTKNKAKAEELAESNDGETIRILKDLASSIKSAICGSFLAKDAEGLHNRGFLIEPNGDVALYDKHHLFIKSHEADVFVSGDKLAPVVRYRGWNLTIQVCYDLRFPVWMRNTDNKYDAMIVPANWPDSRAYAWHHLLIARAIENQCYVIGANRSGEDGFGCYDNLSQIYDFSGKPVGKTDGKVTIATLDRPALREYRDYFPAWKDADRFSINQ